MREFAMYIMTNKPYGTIYVGSTSDLAKRIWQHKNKFIPSFTSQYNLNKLVYYEIHGSYVEYARREKRLKNWCRQWKLDLIDEFNPGWDDLYMTVCD